MKEKSCLLVIDMQVGVFKQKQPVFNESGLIQNIGKLIHWARQNAVEVFFTQHENSSFLKPGSPDWEIISQLEVHDTDTVIHKKHPGIFTETELSEKLKNENISRLYITGLISNGCIKAAFLDALKLAFEVVLIQDAHSTFYKNAAKIIEQVNREAENAGACLKATQELLMLNQ